MSRSTKAPARAGNRTGHRAAPMAPVSDCLRRPKGHLARLIAQTDQLARINKVLQAYLPLHLQSHASLMTLGPQSWVVQTDSPAWATRLRYVLPSLQQQLSEHFGYAVPTLTVRIQPSAAPKTEPPPRRMTMTQKSAKCLAGAAEGISDQRLGAALMRLAEHARQRPN